MKNFKFLSGIAVALLLAGAGCYQQPAAPNTGDTATQGGQAAPAAQRIKVGVELPFTGDVASYGEGIKKAIELAVKDLKLDNVDLVYEDSQCKGNLAVNAMTKLSTSDGVVAVVGDLCSSASSAAAPVAEANHVPMVSPGSTAPSLSQAGDYFFRTLPSDSFQAKFGAGYLAGKGFKKLAILYTNEDYGSGFNTVLKEEFPKLEGVVVASEAVTSGSTELRTQLTKIKSAKPDVVYLIANSADTMVASLKQAKELGIKAVLVGAEGYKSDDTIKGAKAAAEGLLITYPSGSTQEFSDEHKAAYGTEPGPFAAQGYDAMKAIGLAIQAGATTGEQVKDALYKTEFDGASGHIKFDANGDVDGKYDVYLVKNGKFELAQ